MSNDAIVEFHKSTNGWYETTIKVETSRRFEELLNWITDNLQGHHKHTIWRLTENNDFTIRFRYSRDYEWFLLRWA